MSKKKAKDLDFSPETLAREQREREANFRKNWPKIQRAFRKMGRESGDEIAALAQKLHPKAVIVPLYRSAFVLLPQTRQERGHHMRVVLYHDPAWMGEDRSVKTLPRYKSEMVIQGQRSGPNIYLDDEEMWSASLAEHMRHHEDRVLRDFAMQPSGDGISLKRRKGLVATYANDLSWGFLEPEREKTNSAKRKVGERKKS